MFYLFLLAHLVADFILQPYWIVERKRRFDGLAIHCGIVLTCMALLPLVDPDARELWPAMLIITAIHFGADWWKVNHGHSIPGPPIVPFMVDQLIHVTTLVTVLSLAVPADQLWSIAGSPSAHMAITAAVYVIAAFATPIAVMVWLDPRFEFLALAGKARLRCLVAGIGVVSLMLVSGVLAFPAALVGLTVATRRPFSSHPLDAPAGLLTVITVAASLGALLLILPR
jgi:Protein of unknown function (DUF3307)